MKAEAGMMIGEVYVQDLLLFSEFWEWARATAKRKLKELVEGFAASIGFQCPIAVEFMKGNYIHLNVVEETK